MRTTATSPFLPLLGKERARKNPNPKVAEAMGYGAVKMGVVVSMITKRMYENYYSEKQDSFSSPLKVKREKLYEGLQQPHPCPLLVKERVRKNPNPKVAEV